MVDVISAAEANRRFSRVLREVGEGRSYIVTSHGRPVARIIPAADEPERRARAGAKSRLISLLRQHPAQGLGRWNRDELYER